MNSDYYTTKIVEKFVDQPSNSNYEQDIHLRNPIVKGKLTGNYPEIVELFARILKPKSFVELGVQCGEVVKNLVKLVPELIGVDATPSALMNQLVKDNSNVKYFQSSTISFFRNIPINRKFDMILINKATHEETLTDFDYIFSHMNEDGFLFLHNTYPADEYWVSPLLCGDSWKTAKHIREKYNKKCEILTLPLNPGLSIVRKCSRQIRWKEPSEEEIRKSTPRLVATGDSQSIVFWKIPFVSEHWLGFNTSLPLTMHRVGKDGLNIGDIPKTLGNGHEKFPIIPGNTIIYCYGYIDIQRRVFEQVVGKGRSLDEVLTKLVTDYFKVILENEQKFKVLSCVYSVLPPSIRNKEATPLCSLEQRIEATKQINSMLIEQCKIYNIKYLDMYSVMVDEKGVFRDELTSDGSHLDSSKVELLENELRKVFDSDTCSVVKCLD